MYWFLVIGGKDAIILNKHLPEQVEPLDHPQQEGTFLFEDCFYQPLTVYNETVSDK